MAGGGGGGEQPSPRLLTISKRASGSSRRCVVLTGYVPQEEVAVYQPTGALVWVPMLFYYRLPEQIEKKKKKKFEEWLEELKLLEFKRAKLAL